MQTRSQPSGGARARKRLICGDDPSLLSSRSGVEHLLASPEGVVASEGRRKVFGTTQIKAHSDL